MPKQDYYLSIDVEADGPIPGYNSMLSFGTVLYDDKGVEIDTFKVNLKPLEYGVTDVNTMRWWGSNKEAYNKTREDIKDVATSMYDFIHWMDNYKSQGIRLTAIGYPITYDFMWLYWYCMRFVGRCPFGFAGMDIKTMLAIALNKPFKTIGKRDLPIELRCVEFKHTHDPLDDAREQGALFFTTLKYIENDWK